MRRAALVALVAFAALAALTASPAFALEGQDVAISIRAGNSSYIRGEVNPARGLVVTLTVKNTSDRIPVDLPRPDLDPLSDLSFSIFRKGKPTGEKYKVAERVKVIRKPEYEPVGDNVPVKDVALEAGQSADFKLNVGAYYHFDMAGTYEITAKFQGTTSNTIDVEVLPLKRVEAFVGELLERLEHFELGRPEFPFMFYIVKSRRHWDQIVYLRRIGKPAIGRYEHYRLCELPRGSEAQIIAGGAGDKTGQVIGVLAKNRWNKWRLYRIDFSGRMVKATSHDVEASPDSTPTLTKGADGEPQVQG